MSKQLSNEEFQERAKQLNKNLTVLGEYSRMKDRILVRCNDCGREMKSLPQVILGGGGCCKCRGKRITASKLTPIEKLKERIETINPNIEVLYEEHNSIRQYGEKRWRTLRCKCKKCGKEWSKEKDYLLIGVGCPACYKEGKVVDHNTFLEKMGRLHPDIEVLGTYTNYHGKVRLRCKIDNYEWEAEPAKLFRTGEDGATGCPLCGGTLQLTHEEFCKRINVLNPDIIIENMYINNQTDMKCRCKKCNHKWDTKAFNLMYNSSYCPNCQTNRSKGEMQIYLYLSNNNIEFEEQKAFDDCVDKQKLYFDFYIPSTRTCIEYDGSQHYMETPHFAKNKYHDPNVQLEYYQRHDQIKTNYCKDHNIKLLRIPYTEYKNINIILDQTFKELSSDLLTG